MALPLQALAFAGWAWTSAVLIIQMVTHVNDEGYSEVDGHSNGRGDNADAHDGDAYS